MKNVIEKLRNTAKEMNEKMGLDPAIDLEQEEEKLIEEIKINAEEILPDDEFSDETWDVIEEITEGKYKRKEKSKKTNNAKKKKVKTGSSIKKKVETGGFIKKRVKGGMINAVKELIKNNATEQEIEKFFIDTYKDSSEEFALKRMKIYLKLVEKKI